MDILPRVPALFLTGPTGSGKSALALELAEEFGGEIINGDAFQVYRGLPILTAQPREPEFRQAPHHLYGFVDPSGEFDAARYVVHASATVEAVRRRGRLPIVVGGSGLYLKALTHGLEELPTGDEALRAEMAKLANEELVAWLLRLDPLAEAVVNLQNPRHVQRALEISLLTGTPASEFKQRWKNQRVIPCGLFLHLDREWLYERINLRTVQMFAEGAAQEVARLGHLSVTAVKAIGVREIQALLRGEITELAAMRQIQLATRHYAKRQVTWFRRESCFQRVSTTEEARQAFRALIKGAQANLKQ